MESAQFHPAGPHFRGRLPVRRGDANRWVAESRNVAADYERAFGKPAPHVKGLRLQINSQHTGTVAESYFGEVAFRSTPQ